MRFDHVASYIVNANHSIMRTAVKLGKADGVADCVWPGIPQWTVCQRIGNQIDGRDDDHQNQTTR
jgi:hypothetical protein